MKDDIFKQVAGEIEEGCRLLNGFIRYVKQKKESPR